MLKALIEEDIKFMGAIGIEVMEEYLLSVSTKIKLFNSQEWYLREGYAVRFCRLFEKGMPVEYECDRKALSEVYPKIKLLFDKKNKIIAQRSGPGSRLITTKYNKWLSCSSRNKEKTALEIYTMIEAIEDRKFAKKMLEHYYSKKHKVSQKN